MIERSSVSYLLRGTTLRMWSKSLTLLRRGPGPRSCWTWLGGVRFAAGSADLHRHNAHTPDMTLPSRFDSQGCAYRHFDNNGIRIDRVLLHLHTYLPAAFCS
eukprot:4732372-Amphidinium_carterae.1